jgi:hypothetical protein
MLYHTGQLANKQIDEELISCKKEIPETKNTGPAVKKVSYQSFSVESNQVCGLRYIKCVEHSLILTLWFSAKLKGQYMATDYRRLLHRSLQYMK